MKRLQCRLDDELARSTTTIAFMASADILECGVCMERFDREARQSKLLPCGHTLCVRCVGELSRPAGREYSCPTCRKVDTYEQPAANTIPELNVHSLSLTGPSQHRDEKAELLQRIGRSGVRRLAGVWCHKDSDWALSLLQAAAGRLEEANVCQPRPEHQLALSASPGLRRLCVYASDGALTQQPPELTTPARPGGGLQWLQVSGATLLPRATLRSLLRAHAASLATLWLDVGTPGSEDWPEHCSDLHALLAECGLAALRKLVLKRYGVPHDEACPVQLRAVRAVLPAAEVLCEQCDDVAWEHF